MVRHRLPAIVDPGFFARVGEPRLCRFELEQHNLKILGLGSLNVFPETPFFQPVFVLGLAGPGSAQRLGKMDKYLSSSWPLRAESSRRVHWVKMNS